MLDVTTDESQDDLVAAGLDAGIQLGEFIEQDMIAVRVFKAAHPRPGQEAVGSRLALCCELRRADRGTRSA